MGMIDNHSSDRRVELRERRSLLQKRLRHQEQQAKCQDLLDILGQEQIEYKIHWAEEAIARTLTRWLMDHFPIRWNRVDWGRDPDAVCRLWRTPEDQMAIAQMMLEAWSDTLCIHVLWADANTPVITVPLGAVRSRVALFFEPSWDTWLLCPELGWCLECFHEGELCFGYMVSDCWMDESHSRIE
jgi:hypothetical protein